MCLSVGHVRELCKMAQPIEMLFVGLSRVGPRHYVLDRVQIPKGKRQIWGVVCPNEKHWEPLLRCTENG